MSVQYQIVITRIETDIPYTRRDWRKVVDEPDEKHSEIYAYVDSDGEKDVETKVYEQLVDNIDMVKVINAINGVDDKRIIETGNSNVSVEGKQI